MTCLNDEPVYKSPVSDILVEYDLTNYLASGETLESVPAPEFTSVPPGLIFSDVVISQNSKAVQVMAAGGDEYQDYHGLMKFSTSIGQEDEVSMWFRVLSTGLQG